MKKGRDSMELNMMPIAKVDDSTRIIIGIVYKAAKKFDEKGNAIDNIDTHGNWAKEEEIKKACHNFNKKLQNKKLIGKIGVDKQHNEKAGYGIVVESYIAMSDIPEINAEKGDWVAAVEVTDDECWKQIQKGEIEGFSIGGKATITTNQKEGGKEA